MEKQKLPNSTAVLVLGILSIPTCCCYGVISIILGIIALILANKDTALYNSNPELYDGFKNIKTGKILAIIGIVLGFIYLIYMAWIVATFGIEGLSDPQMLQEMINEKFGI